MRTFEAVYYDGRSSERHAVLVHVVDDGSVQVVGPAIDLHVSTGELRPAPRLGDAVRSISLGADRKLETMDNEAVDLLAGVLHQGRGAGWVHRLERSWTAVVVALVAVIGIIGAGATWGVPLGARVVASRLPGALAHRVGQDTLAVLDKTLFHPSEASPEQRGRIEDVFAGLAALEPDLPLRLELRNMGKGQNAFALPDGTVIVTDGLLELAENDEELAAVLAHEFAHVRHRHGLRMVLESSSFAILVGVYVGDVGQISTVLAALPAMYSQAGYSRAHETEADEFAFQLMERAGVAPHHFATILRKLQAATGAEDTGALRYLSTHPPSEERVSRFERR